MADDLNDKIIEFVEQFDRVEKINDTNEKFGIDVQLDQFPMDLFFSDEHRSLSPSEFRKIYSKRKVGLDYKLAYRLVTQKDYEYRTTSILRVVLVISIGLAIMVGAYFLVPLTFPFLKKEWKWWIPILLGFIYFAINLSMKSRE